jgi:hypothetical protein
MQIELELGKIALAIVSSGPDRRQRQHRVRADTKLRRKEERSFLRRKPAIS